MTNRLARETSPYLLQHAENPVDWRPWGSEAIETSRAQQKPIFLSIGYSACHWCHVMEHESFEDPAIAARMNASFVCIKVDREERPDLDQIYMHAVQLMTGHGGWPMSVFLTPELEPFFGGTYWPPRAAMGRPGFDQVLEAVATAWRERREQAIEHAGKLTQRVQEIAQPASDGGAAGLTRELCDAALPRLRGVFDAVHGGFGGAPKFPHPMDLQLLLRLARRFPESDALPMVRLTLDRMAAGGIYDHLGGGFARYSVDARWLTPHFEKMLYDNALLAGVYLDAYLANGAEPDRRVVEETLDYVLRDMTDPQGGFHSTEDADSEGEEGKFYVWTPAEITAVLGPDIGERFCYVYDVSSGGNFEGHNILNRPRTLEQAAQLRGWEAATLTRQMQEARQRLLAARNRRVRPAKDDKILVSWNGLMIDTLARAGAALQRRDYTASAIKAALFLRQHLWRAGRLLHGWRNGQARLNAYLDDYSNLCNAMISLYEATFDEAWIDWAMQLADVLLQQFHDPRGGGFFYTSNDHEQLIARSKDLFDASTPSGNGMAATALIRLATLSGRQDYLQAAESALTLAAALLERGIQAGQLYLALDLWLAERSELVVCGGGPMGRELGASLQRRFLPYSVRAFRQAPPDAPSALDPLFEGKTFSDEPQLYICQGFACQAPLAGQESITTAIQQLK